MSYQKSRIDALTDGIFAVAMTILVLDLRLPEGLHEDEASLIAALKDLWPKFLPYVLSFYVLGSSWTSNIKQRTKAELVERHVVSLSLGYLFVVTCLPFSTSVLGRYAELRAAVCLYALNMAALSVMGYLQVRSLPDRLHAHTVTDRTISLGVMLVASAACIAASFVSPPKALWVYTLNLATPWLIARAARQDPRSTRGR